VAGSGEAYCFCLPDYHPVGLACVPNATGDPCEGIDCGGHGRCVVAGGAPECLCDDGYGHPRDDGEHDGTEYPLGYPLLCVPEVLDGGDVADDSAADDVAAEDEASVEDGDAGDACGPELSNGLDDDSDGATDEGDI
jgi:hypothetical protein